MWCPCIQILRVMTPVFWLLEGESMGAKTSTSPSFEVCDTEAVGGVQSHTAVPNHTTQQGPQLRRDPVQRDLRGHAAHFVRTWQSVDGTHSQTLKGQRNKGERIWAASCTVGDTIIFVSWCYVNVGMHDKPVSYFKIWDFWALFKRDSTWKCVLK